jgi:hypothetical protein
MKKVPTSITLEEAVAYMVNMYLPEGFILLDILEAFSEVAEVEYENDRSDPAFETRKEACTARYIFAEQLIKSLQYEVDHQENSIIVLAGEASGKQLLTFESVSDWAADKYGIDISSWRKDTADKKYSWEDVTIKIKENHKIGYAIKKGKFTYKHLKDVGLMGKDKHEPNEKYNILMRLSLGKAFPPGNQVENKYSKAIYDIGLVLKKLIPLQDGPFHRFNPNEGCKPRFKLTSYLADDDEYIQKYKKN